MAENAIEQQPSRRPVWAPLARLINLLPTGTAVTAIGVGVLGLASYVHLAIAGHSLSHAEMADLSVLWSVVFSVGLGIFLPVEQELTRVVAARRVNGIGTRPAWQRGNVIAAVLLAGLGLVLAGASRLIADHFFTGALVLVLVTAGGLFGVGAASPVRGQAAGAARFDLYSAQLGLDGTLRIVLAVALGLAGAHSAVSFGLVLTVAPLVATLIVFRPVQRTTTPGPAASWGELGHGVAPLMISMLLGQFMLNSVIVSARIVAPDQTDLAAALLSALVLVRVPTLIFGALQASLLSGLAGSATEASSAAFRRLLNHGCVVVTGLMVAIGVPMITIGPWLVRFAFDAPDVLSRLDFAVLTAGTLAYLLALVLGQGVMTLRGHRLQMTAWVVGAAVLALVMAIPGPAVTRLAWGYLVGNAVVAGILGAVLLVRARLHWSRHDEIA